MQEPWTIRNKWNVCLTLFFELKMLPKPDLQNLFLLVDQLKPKILSGFVELLQINLRHK